MRAAVVSPKLLAEDARNRTFRTLIQQLAIDVGVAVFLSANVLLRDTEHWGDLEWNLIVLTLIKTALAAGASFAMRYWLDSSSIPTPLPPAPQAEPAERAPVSTVSDDSSTLG